MKKAALLLVTLLISAISFAQSKQETKWYNKAKDAKTVEAYDIFLKRYPKSVYRNEIDSLRHDALYVTHMDNNEALQIISTLNPVLKPDVNQPEFFKAVAFRDEGRDFILGVNVRQEGVPHDTLVFHITEKINGIWQMPVEKRFPKRIQEDKTYSILSGDENIVTINGEKWLHYSYRNSSDDGEKLEQVEALLPVGAYVFDNQEPTSVFLSFVGSRLSGKRIEGLMPELDSIQLVRDGWPKYLYEKLKTNETLVLIAEQDLLTDQSVEWWLKNNPNAQTTAKSVKFGVIPENCSLVSAFKTNREKESGSGWTAALFDIRGYTVVCARNSMGKYVLVWCEPRFRDRSSDRILNTIYFDKGTTLVLFYYQGHKAFKYKVNLSNKSVVR